MFGTNLCFCLGALHGQQTETSTFTETSATEIPKLPWNKGLILSLKSHKMNSTLSHLWKPGEPWVSEAFTSYSIHVVLQVTEQRENILSIPIPPTPPHPQIWLKKVVSCINIAYSHRDAWEFVVSVHSSVRALRTCSIKFKNSNLSTGTWCRWVTALQLEWSFYSLARGEVWLIIDGVLTSLWNCYKSAR